MSVQPTRRYGPAPHVWPAEVVAEAQRRYEAGEAVAAIARAIGRPPASTWHQLRRAGVALRPRNPMAYTATEALALKRRGWTWRRIGERFGVGKETVRMVCTRAILAGRVRA